MLQYVNVTSNHPSQIIDKVSNTGCFTTSHLKAFSTIKKKHIYQLVADREPHKKFVYHDVNPILLFNKEVKRQRKIIWFNPC